MNSAEKIMNSPELKAQSDLITRSIEFNRESPCNDCPFSTHAPYHGGVMNDLELYAEMIKDGTLLHTCHKTDPRLPQDNDGTYDRPQQCPGALMLQLNHDRAEESVRKSVVVKFAEAKGADMNKFNRLSKTMKSVFLSLPDLISHYLTVGQKELDERNGK